MDDRKVGELGLKTSFYQRKVGDRDIVVSLLFVQIVFKFFINENLKMDFSKYIGCGLNEKFNFYLVKLVLVNKKS